jgi:hypothetical protein
MKLGAARRRFYRLLEANGLEPASLTPAQGLDWMLHTYRTERYRGCDPEHGGDTLSFRWGVRYWGRGEWFEVEVARRLLNEEIGRGRLLRLVFRFLPASVEVPAKEGALSCSAPAEIARFRRRVTRSAGYRAAIGKSHAHVDLLFPPLRRA